MKQSLRSALLVAAMLGLSACNTDANAKLQTQGDAYIRENISSLSPRAAVLGGKFIVTDLEWIDSDTARVTYEDGHVRFRGETDVSVKGNQVSATRIRFDMGRDTDTSSSTTSTSSSNSSSSQTSSRTTSSSLSSSRTSSAGASASSSVSSSVISSRSSAPSSSFSMSSSTWNNAQLGEFCGGIAGIQCGSGLSCQYDGAYPDAGGTCVRL